MSLLFDEVLAHIQRAGDQNDEALDDVLQAGIDGKEGQRSEDNTQDENTEHDAADLAGAADERNAADDAGRNGITLIVQAGGLRDGADARALDKAGQTVHHARECVDKDRRAENIHAGDIGSLGIRADGEHVLAERRLVPQEPGDGKQDDGIKHIPRQADSADGDHLALDEARITVGQAGQRLAVVIVEHEEHEDQAIGDELRGQRDDEGMQLELCNKETVDKADDCTDGDDRKNGDADTGPGWDIRHPAEHSAGKVRLLQQGGRKGGGQADDTAAGKVGARQDDAARNAERERKGRSGQRDDVRDGADLQEVMVDDGGVDDEDRHQDVQRIVQNAVRPEAALVAPVQLAVVRSRIANFCHRICHDRGPPLNVFCCQPHDFFLAGRFGIHFTGKAAA